MYITQWWIIGAVLSFLFIFLSGFWVSNSGKPINSLILTIHKLISLGAIAFLVVTIVQVNKVSGLRTIALAICIVTGIFFLGTIITGGLLSTGNSMPEVVVKVHHITPYLTALSTGAMLYFLLM